MMPDSSIEFAENYPWGMGGGGGGGQLKVPAAFSSEEVNLKLLQLNLVY